MTTFVYVNVDTNGNILDGVCGKDIIVNKADYQYEFSVNDDSILVEFEKYKVIDEVLVKGV